MDNVFYYQCQQNIGRAKYVVNYYTGKKHADGSDFMDIAIFSNKRKKDRFIKELKKTSHLIAI